MRIVVDFQEAQAESAQSDNTRFLIMLIKKIIVHGDHDVFISLNGLFKNEVNRFRAVFNDILPQDRIHVWWDPLAACGTYTNKTAELIREASLARLNPDFVITTTGLSKKNNYVVTKFVHLYSAVSTAIIVFPGSDLSEYESNLDYLQQADVLLPTSKDVQQNLCQYAGLGSKKIIDISDDQTENVDSMLSALLECSEKRRKNKKIDSNHKPKMAYVSPFPPVRSGISDYSVELLPELARHYDIDIIINQRSISGASIVGNCTIRDVKWFRENADKYERVLYHFGNSEAHKYMFGLLDEVPGVVVLHDFFLGHVVKYLSIPSQANAWPLALYRNNGYKALMDFFSKDGSEALWNYPSNLDVLQKALGVIVHSESSQKLAATWYGYDAARNWQVIPLLRQQRPLSSQAAARLALGIDLDRFVVCSFGMVNINKNNHRLLDAWFASSLSKNPRCMLIFVGESAGQYGKSLFNRIRSENAEKTVKITGWNDMDVFQHYLTAADMGVQLRTRTRGETSAAALDCMNYGLATIVNANGSLSYLPDDGVWKIPDEFHDVQLIEALEALWKDEDKRLKLATRAREIVRNNHAPHNCAYLYRSAIEDMYRKSAFTIKKLCSALFQEIPDNVDDYCEIANNLSDSFPVQPSARQILVDVSALVQKDLGTGIQRVVRSVLKHLLLAPRMGDRVEPVYLSEDGCFYYARKFTKKFLELPSSIYLSDDPVEFRSGDIYLGLDLHQRAALYGELYQSVRQRGVKVFFVVYDLLPVLYPQFFYPEIENAHQKWLEVVSQCDGAICISRAVAEDMIEWLEQNAPIRSGALRIGWFHLGADISFAKPTKGMPRQAKKILETLSKRPSFLMVGTIEPRKGYAQVLEAFDILWSQGCDVNLVIVGKEGWLSKALVQKIKKHPRLKNKFFWLQNVTDEYLEKIYQVSTCLIAASEAEGFGLPLIEGAQRKIHIIARDIPVFREVAGDHAWYFSGLEARDLASSVVTWLAQFKNGEVPNAQTMPWLTWTQSTEKLMHVFLDSNWMTQWEPKYVKDIMDNSSDVKSFSQLNVNRCA